MATITTSTATNSISGAFGYPPNSMMDLNVQTGELWIAFRDLSNRGAIWKSADAGATWTFMNNFTVAGYTIEDIQEMRIDSAGENIHMVMLCTDGSAETMHYKRFDISSGSVAGPTGTVVFSGPAGTLQSLIFSSACVPVRNPDGSYHVFLACAQHNGVSSGVRVYVITVKADKTTYINDAVIGPTREWRATGDDTSMTVCVDVEHNGDGITSSTPNVWVMWLMNSILYTVRCTWKGYRAGWQTPTQVGAAGTGRVAERDAIGRWDGTRFVITSQNPGALAQMQLFDRNASNTNNLALLTSPNHPNGSITGAKAMSYNHVTKDVRIYAVVGANPIYYIDWIRETNTWGSWTSTGITPVTSEWGVRRGTYGDAQFDLYMQTGGGSPWTVASLAQAVNFAPTAPTWVTGVAGTVGQNGASFDVALNLTLDWDFHDPNTADAQASYALSRQIGAATIQWWRASDSTWQLTETWNSTATTMVTLAPANWVGGGGAADLAHVYKVATRDSGSLTSPYSIGLAVVPSSRVDPTVTAPAYATTLNSGLINVTWTVSEQSQWRITVTPTILTDTFSRTTSSGWGSSDNNQPWTITGSTPNSDYSVSTGSGRHSHASNFLTKETSALGVVASDVEILAVSVGPSAALLTANAEVTIRARIVDTNNFVYLKTFFNTAGGPPTIVVAQVVGGVTTVSGFITPSASIASAGPVNLRFLVSGGQLYGRMWATATEPTEWHVGLATTHLAAGPISFHTLINTGNTNTKPLSFSVGDLIVVHASQKQYDSGFVTDPTPAAPVTLAHTPAVQFPDGYQGVVTLQTKNVEGLASQTQTVPFTIDFVEPVTPTVVPTAAASSGGINVVVAQPAPAGAQPVTDRRDIWRRKVVVGTVNPANSNPYFETNANDWTNSGYSTVARSTAQFHEGVASILLTPNGSTATPKVQTTALYPVTALTRWEFRGWLRSTTANKTMRVYIDWYDGTPTLLGSTVRDFTPVATTWMFAWVRGTAPAGATQARIAIGQLVTPAAGDTLYGDELGLYAANDDAGIRIVASAAVGTTYLDWRAVTGVDYEYAVHAYGVNGTDTWGPWVD